LILASAFGINAQIAAAAGRDPTLTGRTQMWEMLLSMRTNPLVGTGYESFWLGPRLEWIWDHSGFGEIAEAHNGYLEIYLNLGIIGLFLFGAFLITSYRTICRRLTPFSSFASFTLVLWGVALFYNVTEAAFKGHFIWVTFLLAAIAVPGRAEDQADGISELDNAAAAERAPSLPLETTSSRS
jgi:O-antigen ligase